MAIEGIETVDGLQPPQTGATSATDATALRLGDVSDAALMTRTLEAGLAELSGEPVALVSYQIDYCKVKPGRDINLALTVAFRQPSTGLTERRNLSCTIRGTGAEAAAQFAEESARFDALDLTDRDDLRGFRQVSALVPGMPAVIRLFPADPILLALAGATDPAELAPRLDGMRLADDDTPRTIRDIRWDVVHYKPGRTCTLRYAIDLEERGGRGTRTVECYGKVYRDERWQQHHELLRASSEAARVSRGAWRAARPLGVVPEWRFVLQEALPGRRFSHVFTDLTHDHAGEAEIAEAATHLRAVARAVRSMQFAPAAIGTELDFGVLFAAQERNLGYLQRAHPELASEISRLRAEMIRLEPSIPRSPTGLAHGDFAHGNVLLDGGSIAIIDFDRAGQAETVYDVAYFLTHLCSYGIRHPRRAHIGRLCDAFRDEYLRLAPDASPRRLALYEALDLSAYILRNFRKQSHEAKWLRWAPEQIRAAWDRLTVATA